MKIVVGGNCARSLAILLGAAAVGAIFAGFACDIGEKARPTLLEQQ